MMRKPLIKLKKLHIAATLFSLLLTVGCGSTPVKEQDSQTKFGRMRDNNIMTLTVPKATNYLTYVKPYGSIYLCEIGSRRYARDGGGALVSVRDMVAQALRTWLSALMRENVVSVIATDDCKMKVADGSALITFQYGDNIICNNAAAYTRPNLPLIDKNRYGANIFFCENSVRNFSAGDYFGLSLHESGHAFGLCDQYGTDNGTFKNVHMNDNCDNVVRSDLAPYSVMNAGWSGKLTDDDLLGVRLLSCLESTEPASSQWAQWRGNVDAFHASSYSINFENNTTLLTSFPTELSRLTRGGVKISADCLR